MEGSYGRQCWYYEPNAILTCPCSQLQCMGRHLCYAALAHGQTQCMVLWLQTETTLTQAATCTAARAAGSLQQLHHRDFAPLLGDLDTGKHHQIHVDLHVYHIKTQALSFFGICCSYGD